ncbi:tetratricopeptide repeat protein [Nocardia sp. SC052]|uniref:tetratricopeptide repeat protein n=1 Tax=Nocardia sichangensis TaxID=3385975 RepID=UPI00399F6618
MTAQDISDWIDHRRKRAVAPSTIGDWLKPQPVIPRTDEKFLLVVECLHAAVSEQWTTAARERWKKLRAAAYAEVRPVPQRTRGADIDAGDAEPVGADENRGGPASVVVGLVPQEPVHFVDREQFRDLDQGLAHGRVAVVVTGMRGAGKTQLAAAYARQVLDHERGLVGWVNAETVDTLFTGLAEIADHLGVAAPDGDPAKSAYRLRDHLNNHLDRHLLVFDNAIDPDKLRAVLPTRGGTRVVITTTNQAMTRLADVTVDAGTGYTPKQAHTYLRKATGIRDDPDGEQQLAEELGSLPLAVAAAAAAINPPYGPALTYDVYLTRLRAQPLPRALRRREGADHPQSVDQAITLSIRAAETSTGDPELDTVVTWLLGLFAVLSTAGVKRALLIHPDPSLDELVDEAIDRCVQYSLLSWSTDNTALSTHRLTARVLRERARDADTEETLLSHALEVIEPRLFASSEAWSRRVEGAHLVDQIQSLHAADLPTGTDTSTRLLAAFRWATAQLTAAADLGRAITQARHTHTRHQQILGPDHPETLTSRNNLAHVCRLAGKVAEAITLFEQNLDDRIRVLGASHPHTLMSRGNLATAYQVAGRVAEAISLYEQILPDFERVFGPYHLHTLTTRNNLADAYKSAGQLSAAVSLFERNLAESERVRGADHPDTLSSRNNLAHAYQLAGRGAEAIPLHERNLVERIRILGADHPDTLGTRNNLAQAYESVRRITEAILLYERNLADYERVLGADHPATLISRNNLAAAYRSVGRLDEAISLYEQALIEFERVLGAGHPNTLQSRNNLAYAYQVAERMTEAIPLFERNLTDHERLLGLNHPATLASRNNLAAAYQTADRVDEAISLFERNLTESQRVLEADHPEIFHARGNLALAYQSAGRIAAAIPLYEQILTERKRKLGADHPGTMALRDFLVVMRIWAGRSED